MSSSPGRHRQRLAFPVSCLPEWRRRLPFPLRDLAHLRGQAHVLHGDGDGSIFEDESAAIVAMRPDRKGRRIRHDRAQPHRVHLLQRHHGL